jgi:electron transfer flavoprotein alpha subunit
MADVLAFAEQRDGQIGGSAREAVSAAARLAESLGGSAHALVLGAPGISGAGEELGRFGAAKVLAGEHEALGDYNPEAYASVLAARIEEGGYGAVIFPATTLGKDLAPRVAAALDVPLAADVTGLEAEGGKVSIVRPVYSGKAFAHLEVEASPVLVSIRPNVFQATELGAAGDVETFTPDIDASAFKVRVVERKGRPTVRSTWPRRPSSFRVGAA